MPSTTLPALTDDELDDILYFSRTGGLTELKTAIETSAKQSHVSSHDILLAAVDQDSGNSALHMASANGHTETLTYILSLAPPPLATTLLSLPNSSGNTPLHWASLNGHLEAVKLLVQAGADPGVTNKAGHDAVYEAEANGKETVVEWLLTEGRGLDTGLKWSVEVDGAERSGASGMEEEVEGMDVVGQAD